MDIGVIMIGLFGLFWFAGLLIGTWFGYRLRMFHCGPHCQEELAPLYGVVVVPADTGVKGQLL